MTPAALNILTKQIASRLGFDSCGVARAGKISRTDYVREWLDSPRVGSMSYMQQHFDKRVDPSVLLEGARSVIVGALLYHQRTSDRTAMVEKSHGKVAMYAWGDDYHRVIKDKLRNMEKELRAATGGEHAFKACVDTAPIIEREWAARAGVGWIGKNTLAMSEGLGSYFFLGALLTTAEIAEDQPAIDHCGTCTACLDACPTDAFPAAYEMDASRCISYLTIEHRTEIDTALHEKMGDWVFGCDVCQEVCPHNRKAPTTSEPQFAIRPPGPFLDLRALLEWNAEDYARELRGSAMKRAKLPMLKRNARLVLENQRASKDV